MLRHASQYMIASVVAAIFGFLGTATFTRMLSPGDYGIYVIGVDPAAQARGLGSTMLHAGCDWMSAAGMPQVMLYVDSANAAGLRLYERAAFALHHEDVLFASTPAAPDPQAAGR